MNILYWLRQYPKISESFVLNEIHELERRGHNVAIFALDNPGETVVHNEVTSLDLPVHYANLPPHIDFSALLNRAILDDKIRKEAYHFTRPVYQLGSLYLASQCINFLEKEDFDVDIIHSHFATVDKFGAQYTAAYFDVPHTITAHAFEIFSDPDWSTLNTLFSKCDRIIVPSQYNKSYLEQNSTTDRPIDVVPATTRVKKFEPTDRENPNRLLSVGRLVEKKGFRYAIEAVAELQTDFPDIEYHIIGSGELKADLQELVAKRGLEEHIQFFSNISDDQLIEEYDQAAVFVLPCVVAEDGDRDAMPVVLKEAMAMKTVCVSTTVSAVPELITDGHDGILVEPENSEALANAIRQLLSQPARRNEIGINARKTVKEKFNIQDCVGTLVKSFEVAKYEDSQKG